MADPNVTVQTGNPGGGGAGAQNVAPVNNVVAPAIALRLKLSFQITFSLSD